MTKPWGATAVGTQTVRRPRSKRPNQILITSQHYGGLLPDIGGLSGGTADAQRLGPGSREGREPSGAVALLPDLRALAAELEEVGNRDVCKDMAAIELSS